MRYLWILFFLLATGCLGDDGNEKKAATSPDASNTPDASEPANAGSDICWWCVDTSTPDVTIVIEEGGKGEGKGDDKGNDKGNDKGVALLLVLSGTWSDATREGDIDITLLEGSEKTPVCDISLSIASSSPDESCTNCTFAWSFTLGERTVNLDGETCVLLEGIAADEHLYGHGNTGELFTAKGTGWFVVDNGTSTYEEGAWEFEYSYSFASGGGKDEGGDNSNGGEACYDACIAKGESEEVCVAACGVGGSGKDDSADDGSK